MESQNVTPEEWEDRLIHFSLGALEPEDAARFEAALEQCRERARLATSYSQVIGLLGTTAPTVEPPAGHKARLLQRIESTPQIAQSPAVSRPVRLTTAEPASVTPTPSQMVDVRRQADAWPRVAAAAAVLLLVAVVWLVATLGTVSQQQTRLAEFERQLEASQAQVNIPAGYRTFALAPTDEYTGVSAVVIFNPESSEAWLVADGLEPLPEDLIYELWLIQPQGQGPSDVGGVFGPNDVGSTVHRTTAQRRIGDYAGFAVSIERKPGVPVREGPIVVVGRFEGQ